MIKGKSLLYNVPKEKYLIAILMLLISTKITAQNLVKNPSFEETEKCVDSASVFGSNVVEWSTPSLGTTDLFNYCSIGEIGIPDNFNGHQTSKFGGNYAGCFLYAPNNYREYIQGHFTSPLEKGKKYKVSYYISLADKSNYALQKISFMLTKNRILTPYWSEITRSQIQNLITNSFSINDIENKHSYDDKNNWILVSKEITAKGGEGYITVGNFQNNSSSKKKKVLKGKSSKMSYYYIDMVSVELIDQASNTSLVASIPIESETIKEIIPVEFELEKNYVIENINFQFDSVELSESALEELESIYNYLEDNKNTKIEIFGHTDNKGTNEYNAQLSEKRAYSVADYFRNKGLSKTRIQSFGFGQSKPVSSNDTEKGRKENRRVEFRLSKIESQ